MSYRLFVLAVIISLQGCNDDPAINQLSRDGVFKTTTGEAIIEGELFLPEGDGPFPTVVIVPGSSNEPRDSDRQFVDVLVPEGLGVYLYDKRGVGGSVGEYPEETVDSPNAFLEARAEDVISIVELLLNHERVDNDKLALAGSSQGAWVNSLIYQRLPGIIGYLVMASGGVAPTGIENYYCSLTDDPNLSIEEATAMLEDFDGDLGFDPRPIIQGMDIPVLWLYGEEDRSHPTRFDMAFLTTLDRSNFTVVPLTNTNHDLVDLDTGELSEEVIPALFAWIDDNVR